MMKIILKKKCKNRLVLMKIINITKILLGLWDLFNLQFYENKIIT